ncbi:hypothetical protein M422DRAFT_777663 [Sphaerobolus stellatus SS14]|nr:hypothetical protein M422DRAFT_777663 [Sphaerobolus stellatus SS14]
MQSLFVLSLAASALAAPYPQGAAALGSTAQNTGALSKGVAAAVGATANAAVDAVNVKATYNTIGNDIGNKNDLNVLSGRQVAAASGATGQATDAVGGLIGAAVGAVGNVAADVGDVNVECNEILNDVGNDNNVNILSSRDGSAIASGATQQLTSGLGGLVGAGVGATVNGAVKAVTVVLADNTIANGILDGNKVKILSSRDGSAIASGATNQLTGGAGGLVGAGVGATVNAALKAVTVIVDGNTVLNGVLDGNNVNILSSRQVAAADGATEQLTNGLGGLVGAGVGATLNAAVNAVDVDATYNTIANDILNENDVNVLSGRQLAAASGVTKQVNGAVGGLVGAAAGVVGNAGVNAVDVKATYNTIGNDILNENDVNVLSGRQLAAASGVTKQVNGAVGGLVGAAAGVVANAGVNAVDVKADYNTIANDVANKNDVNVLSSRQLAAASGVTKQVNGAVGGLVGAAAGVVANAGVNAVDVKANYNTIANDVANENNVNVLSSRQLAAASGATEQATGGAGGLAGAGVGGVANVAANLVKIVLADNTVLNGVLNGNVVNVASS